MGSPAPILLHFSGFTDRIRKDKKVSETDRRRKEKKVSEADRRRKEKKVSEADRKRKGFFRIFSETA